MLTTRRLAVIRAALKYWDEEMSPHGTNSFSAYLDEPALASRLTDEDVTYVREWLAQCELRFGLCNEAATALTDLRLFLDADEAGRACDKGFQRIAAILISGIPSMRPTSRTVH